MSRGLIAAVVAMAEDNVIGSSNDLPWYLPADLKHFKKVTDGHVVLMGRKTFESIVNRLGKPLPNRTNVVITRQTDFSYEGVEVFHNLESALAAYEAEDVYVIGGAQIFKQALPFTNRLYLTQVKAQIAGDTYFPVLDSDEWIEVSKESHQADERNPYDYEFLVWDRKNAGNEP